MKYEGVFSCGCEGYVNVIGPYKSRKWKVERAFEDKCDECRKKEFLENLEREKEEAAKKAAEMELPYLQGTEKQVSWANTIRQKYIDYLKRKIIYVNNEDERLHICEREDTSFKHMDTINYIELTDFMINNYTSAKFYINNRDLSIRSISELFYRDIKKENEENKIEKELEQQINQELTAFPLNSELLEPVILEIKKDEIIAKYSKCDKFKDIIKAQDFKWDWYCKKWELKITNKNGSIEDRVIETGNELLNNGFPVRFDNIELKEKAIKAEYNPEITRWIVIMKDGKLGIWFKYRDDELYKKARTIKSSRWDNPYITVKLEYFAEVLDFAELYEFEVKENAIRAIENFKKSLEVIKKIEPEKKEISRHKKDTLEDILDSSDDILDDLKDD